MNTSKSTASSYCNANNPDDGSSSSSSTISANRKRKTETRLGNLLSRVRQKASSSFKLYFDQNDCNSYMEAESECMKSLCGPNGETLDEDEDLWAYIERKAYDHDNEYEEAGQETLNKQNDYIETFTENFCHAITEPKEISRRRICSDCNCSYIGNQCNICIQKKEYSASCIADSNLNLFGNLFEPSCVDDDSQLSNENEEERPSLNQLRERRIQTLAGASIAIATGGKEPLNLDNASASSDVTDVAQHIAKIHHMTIKKDLMDLFITKQINVTDDIRYIWIDPRGQEESGARSGVSRDIYSSFWNEVYNAYLYGEQERVPQVRHDLYKQEWRAIDMIILKGYVDTGYFPISLSRAFLCFCFFGEEEEKKKRRAADIFIPEILVIR
ncbi:uncharacterized protein LOC130646033 [Hydractinia symbiolongicarpus]|uniref:uncharacterized protein LOC130646033 n=1 Tax=Hydractinia symbiolongicarpus TaxID=13093 RepID=UPI00254D0F37|nr:uncharacterized protein LOC130646033 [Hydractinia symbiolongicarpus]